MIEFKSVSKYYGAQVSLNDISLYIESREFFVLLGSSGSGKTTLLKMINRLIEPSQGEVLIDEHDISDKDPITLRRSIGYVVQNGGLFPHLNVFDNIALPLKLAGLPSNTKTRVNELLDLVDLDPDLYAQRFPHELSGGQQQRVGVARALATDPNILLMDEPFGALDAITRSSLQNEFRQLQKRLQKTVVFVTHDIVEAFRLADHIAVLDQGSLQQFGTPSQLLHQPSNQFVRSLIAEPLQQMQQLLDDVS